jgi:hypothetical protein
VQSAMQLKGLATTIFGRSTTMESGSDVPGSNTPGRQNASHSPQPLHDAASITGYQAISSLGAVRCFFFFVGVTESLIRLSFCCKPDYTFPERASSIQIFHEVLEILFPGKNDGPGGADWHTAITEHQAPVRVPDDELRALHPGRIGWTKLKHPWLTENLAVTTSVAEGGLYCWKPRDLLSRSKQTLPSCCRSWFRIRELAHKRELFILLPR